MALRAGINGFGRFGLHLLRYWLCQRGEASFSLDFINDEQLSIDRALAIIHGDPYVSFAGYRVERSDQQISFVGADGAHTLRYTQLPIEDLPWRGEPDLFFECSGRHTDAASIQSALVRQTRIVLISATSWNADATLVYGFNHQTFTPQQHRIVSYGSCTVNGYVPLAKYIHDQYSVLDSDVHVVHNLPEYRLAEHRTLLRKFCTLERSGPLLLPFIDSQKNFCVVYSVVPWTGVSMIDFRFRLQQCPNRDALVEQLTAAVGPGGQLERLYQLVAQDEGPQAHNLTPFSAVIIREGIRVLGDQIYLPGYFDTENSVTRYLDLANYVSVKLSR